MALRIPTAIAEGPLCATPHEALMHARLGRLADLVKALSVQAKIPC